MNLELIMGSPDDEEESRDVSIPNRDLMNLERIRVSLRTSPS